MVAGEAWIRGKGFSTDVTSVAEYDEVLEALPRGARLSPAEVDRARRYAYHFFFRRMIPLPLIESPAQFQFDLAVDDLSQLDRGATRASTRSATASLTARRSRIAAEIPSSASRSAEERHPGMEVDLVVEVS